MSAPDATGTPATTGTPADAGTPPIPTRLHDPEDVRRWRAEGWWEDRGFADFLRETCARHSHRTAVVGLRAADRVDPGRRRTAETVTLDYTGLWEAAGRLAGRLRRYGVRAGDPVLLHLPNTVEYAIGVAALLRMGALPVFALHSHREDTLARLAAACGARVVLDAAEQRPLDRPRLDALCAERGLAPLLLVDAGATTAGATTDGDAPDGDGAAGACPDQDPGSAGLLQLSGGTTGDSKLIPRTHAGYLLSVRVSAGLCGLTPESVLLVSLPASHNFPMSSPGILGAWQVGAAVVLAPDPSPATGLDLVARHGVTHLSLVPPLAQAWIEACRARGVRPEGIEVVGIGGARLAEVVAREVEPVLGGRLQQVFGMAEGLVNYTRLDDPEEVRLSTQGRPMCAADEIRVVGPDGTPLGVGEEGELETRGPYTITRYLGDGPGERESFTDDGWYRTGDLVRLRPDGNLVVTGRSGDRIDRAGEKIPASAVEEHVLDHPAVLDAVAVGLPDERLGEALVLAVVTRGTAAGTPDLRAHLRERGVPAHWLPDRTVVLDAMPTTGVGKNSRRDLRAAVAERLAADAPTATTTREDHR